MIYYIIYTLLTLTAWAFLINYGEVAYPEISTFVALCYTFYSPFFIRRYVERETNWMRLVLFCGPLVGLGTSLYVMFIQSELVTTWWMKLFDSGVVTFAILTASVFNKDDFPKKETQFFFLILAYIYAFSFEKVSDEMFQKLNRGYNFTLPAQQQPPKTTFP